MYIVQPIVKTKRFIKYKRKKKSPHSSRDRKCSWKWLTRTASTRSTMRTCSSMSRTASAFVSRFSKTSKAKIDLLVDKRFPTIWQDLEKLLRALLDLNVEDFEGAQNTIEIVQALRLSLQRQKRALNYVDFFGRFDYYKIEVKDVELILRLTRRANNQVGQIWLRNRCSQRQIFGSGEQREKIMLGIGIS